jgi:hypothetical protein
MIKQIVIRKPPQNKQLLKNKEGEVRGDEKKEENAQSPYSCTLYF